LGRAAQGQDRFEIAALSRYLRPAQKK